MQVGVVMGSKSDLVTMRETIEVLKKLEIEYEVRIVSAHRTPEFMFSYGKEAKERGLKIIIAGAGGAAHLPGMLASLTTLPVIGVPIKSKNLNGLDSLLSIVQMPGGVPVATVAIGEAGAKNAGILAGKILALSDKELDKRLEKYSNDMKNSVLENNIVEE